MSFLAETAVLGHDLKDEGFTFVALQPGYVSTDLGSAMTPHLGVAPPLDPPTSVASQQKVIFGLTRSNNGQFLDQEGNVTDY